MQLVPAAAPVTALYAAAVLLVIADPPSSPLVHETVSVPFPGAAVTPVGAAGRFEPETMLTSVDFLTPPPLIEPTRKK